MEVRFWEHIRELVTNTGELLLSGYDIMRRCGTENFVCFGLFGVEQATEYEMKRYEHKMISIFLPSLNTPHVYHHCMRKESAITQKREGRRKAQVQDSVRDCVVFTSNIAHYWEWKGVTTSRTGYAKSQTTLQSSWSTCC